VIGAAWALVVSVLLTGGLHEDGLADAADGWGGGNSPSSTLEIMRDSRIGSYGAIALVLSFSIRGAAVASLRQPEAAFAALTASGALGRGAMIGLLCLLRPARADGLGATLAPIRPVACFVGLALAAASAMTLGPSRSILGVIAAATATLVVAALAWRRIGGYTGDILGATEQATECVVLTVAASFGTM
jgi:adenosylcobinamide-GDP ribazoletransferase